MFEEIFESILSGGNLVRNDMVTNRATDSITRQRAVFEHRVVLICVVDIIQFEIAFSVLIQIELAFSHHSVTTEAGIHYIAFVLFTFYRIGESNLAVELRK